MASYFFGKNFLYGRSNPSPERITPIKAGWKIPKAASSTTASAKYHRITYQAHLSPRLKPVQATAAKSTPEKKLKRPTSWAEMFTPRTVKAGVSAGNWHTEQIAVYP